MPVDRYGQMFEEWCKAYDPINIELSFIESVIGNNSATILDVGSGTGRLALPLGEHCHRVYALENDIRLQEVAKMKLGDLKKGINVDLLFSDIEQEQVLPNADIVLFSWSFICLNERERVLQKIKGCLENSNFPKVIFIEPWGNSDYADIVLPFLPSKTEKINGQKAYIEPINKVFNDWSLFDYGVHEIPYVFESHESALSVFDFALSEWHGVDMDENKKTALSEVLKNYERDGRFFIFEAPKFMWLEKRA